MAYIKDANNVITIECNYIYPRFACSYLLIEGDKAAFIENNTRFAVPSLLSALEEEGIKRENVQYIIVTHVHLDHAGGTSLLVKECPQAVVIAHERAAPHIIDPEKLIRGSKAVYGEDKFNSLYGNIEPVDEKRVRVAQDGEKIRFGQRDLRFIYTPGHAKHHTCVYDASTNSVFTGDSFGLAYPALQNGDGPFIFPSTTPSDFDAEEARRAVKKITDTGADTMYLTHYGPFKKIKEGADSLIYFLDKIEAIQNEAFQKKLSGDDLDKFCLDRMTDLFYGELGKRKIKLDSEAEGILRADIVLNAQGVAFAVRKMMR